MRERFDFSSISKIILENKKANSLTNTEYYLTLFAYAFSQTDIIILQPSDADINKTIHGQRNVVNDIIIFYQHPENSKYLENDVSNVIQNMIDPAYVNEQLANLLWNDSTISPAKKEELTEDNISLEHFVTECLLFSLSRDFISREKKNGGYATKKRFLLSDYLLDYRFPSVNRVFYGRESDLTEIHRRLYNESCLFLEGIGGIGKSELAKQYGKRFKGEYEYVIFMRYTGNLRRTIIELDFVDDAPKMTEDELFRNHYRFFKQLTSDTLIILDNFDTLPEEDKLFHEFLSLSFRLLVTTRSRIEEVPCYPVRELESMDELLELFYSYAPTSRNKASIVTDIINEVYCHTLTVEMAAKTLIASDLAPEVLLSALQQEGISLSNPNKISVTKDARTKKERLHKHINKLFQLQNLSEMNRFTLLHMILVPDKGIAKGLFHDWMNTIDFNNINELVDYGWVQQDSETNRISLHPFLHEVIADFDQATFAKCSNFLRGIYNDCFRYGIDVPYYHDLLNTIESIFKNITIDDSNSAYLFLDKAIAYLGKYNRTDSMSFLLDVMEKSIPMGSNHKRETATYELYRGHVACARLDLSSARKHYEQGINTLQPLSQEYAELATHFYSNLGNMYAMLNDRKAFLETNKISYALRKKYHLPSNHDSLIQDANLAIAYTMNGDSEKAKSILNPLLKQAQAIPNYGLTLAQIHESLGLAELKDSSDKAKTHFLKAKELFSKHLAPEDGDIQLIDYFASKDPVRS